MKIKGLFIIFLLSFVATITVLMSCNDKDDINDGYGRLFLSFSHKVDDELLMTDTLQYVNAAGNHYMVTEVQYFISDVTLYKNDGTSLLVENPESIHYVDYDIPATLTWLASDSILSGNYDSLSCIFGICEEKNVSGLFTDPPESLMFWPEMMGGGYHYMKMNGKWLDTLNQLSPFNFHLGIGQIYDGQGNITEFVQNYFRVSFPAASFLVQQDKTTEIILTMNIESWFETPHVWDHNYWGGAIMMNQAAMQQAKENGHDIFTAFVIAED